MVSCYSFPKANPRSDSSIYTKMAFVYGGFEPATHQFHSTPQPPSVSFLLCPLPFSSAKEHTVLAVVKDGTESVWLCSLGQWQTESNWTGTLAGTWVVSDLSFLAAFFKSSPSKAGCRLIPAALGVVEHIFCKGGGSGEFASLGRLTLHSFWKFL